MVYKTKQTNKQKMVFTKSQNRPINKFQQKSNGLKITICFNRLWLFLSVIIFSTSFLVKEPLHSFVEPSPLYSWSLVLVRHGPGFAVKEFHLSGKPVESVRQQAEAWDVSATICKKENPFFWH